MYYGGQICCWTWIISSVNSRFRPCRDSVRCDGLFPLSFGVTMRHYCVFESTIRKRKETMNNVTTIGLDISKRVFHLVQLDESNNIMMRKKLRRSQLETFFGGAGNWGCTCSGTTGISSSISVFSPRFKIDSPKPSAVMPISGGRYPGDVEDVR